MTTGSIAAKRRGDVGKIGSMLADVIGLHDAVLLGGLLSCVHA
jgi:hypothetical protein